MSGIFGNNLTGDKLKYKPEGIKDKITKSFYEEIAYYAKTAKIDYKSNYDEIIELVKTI